MRPVVVGAEPLAACTLPVGDAGTIDFGLYQRPIGAVQALMIFVDFPDAPAAGATTPSKDVFLPGAPDWFATTSYGQLQLTVATSSGTLPITWPGSSGSSAGWRPARSRA